MKLRFKLRTLIIATALVGVILGLQALFRPNATIGEHQIPIYPGFRFVSKEPYSREFDWEGDLGLFHGTNWVFETDDEPEDVKEFYVSTYPADTNSILVHMNRPDHLNIIVNFESFSLNNSGGFFSLSMIGRKVTIKEAKAYSPKMTWPDRR